MADLYKLSDGTSSVDMSPTRGLNVLETRIRQHIETKEGKPDTHEWGSAAKYEIPLINLTKARADQLLDWWENMDVLTFTPDQGAPGTTYQMIIDGVERPVNMWHHEYDVKYAGNLILAGVSSQSFSSSHVSVSKSESCSSVNSSTSFSTFSSLSCSVYLVFESQSSSLGIDVVEDASRSSSISRSCSESESESNVESYSTSRSCSDEESTSLYSSYIGGGWSHLSSVSLGSSCEDLSSGSGSGSAGTVSSCEDLSEVSGSDSRSSSLGVIPQLFYSDSCSTDPATSDAVVSAGHKSCSESAGGIS